VPRATKWLFGIEIPRTPRSSIGDSGDKGAIVMIDHTGIGVADVTRSAAFYDAALSALGLRRVIQLPENDGADGIGYGIDYPVFWIDRFHSHNVKQHTAFAAKRALRSTPSTRDTTPPLCSTPTATTWRRSAANGETTVPVRLKIQHLPSSCRRYFDLTVSPCATGSDQQ
jgi:catechol 2,3-dioxygenase-like lactoylglutathione lyase family enzyme